MRILLATFTLTLGVAAANSGAAAPSTSSAITRTRTVPCSESIAGTRFPYLGSNKPKDRYRLVLGVISVPPAYHQQIVRNGTEPWLYFFKAGLINPCEWTIGRCDRAAGLAEPSCHCLGLRGSWRLQLASIRRLQNVAEPRVRLFGRHLPSTA